MIERRFRHITRLATAGALLAVALAPARAALAQDKAPTPEQIEFFEKKIRPVLVEKCYACHSHQAKKLKAEYYTDSRDALRKGGESGEAAVVPGDVSKSPLIKMIQRTDPDAAMPPKEKDALTPEQVKDFEEWVKQGAPDPRNEAEKSEPGKKSAHAGVFPGAEEHWAFKKPVEPVVPAVKDASRAKNPIDAFVLATLESKNMTPAPQADKQTLIRRAYFDLVGLPPTADEVAAFEADASPEAFAKVVDRLLASPHYGERWGRYWLDIARYSDTKGYVFEQERRFPYAYTYRDYVIRAFNEDLPYDQFLIQQIAADKLDLGADKRPLAAMGFLTVGRRFLENPQDIIDDRIDVVTRGTMALTVQCARCHDHKYDPIPTEDYYSLYGVFSSSVEPQQLPSIGGSEQTSASLAFEKELQAREAAVDSFLTQKSNDVLNGLRSATVVADYLMLAQFPGTPAGTLEVNKRVVIRWSEFLGTSKAGHDPIFAPWQAYAAIAPGEFTAKAPAVTEQLFSTPDPTKPINPVVIEMFRGKSTPASMREVADRFAQLFAAESAEQPHGDADKEALRLVLHGPFSPLYAAGDQRMRFLPREDRAQFNELRKKADELRVTDPGAPPAAMVLNDSPTPGDAPILKRGNAGTPGDVAPRRFLKCLSGPDRKSFTDGSGRLELARAIASPENPLTARVMVNRVWMNHFGAGLVRTPSDFGVRCDPPVHPQLLDWLAIRFVEGGWSVKKLHRLIMLSATWQQASDSPGEATYASADPENTLLWRHNRRRMDFESVRDSFLAVANQLDVTPGGRLVDVTDLATNRRTIYGYIDRQNLPGMFRTFDFASPDTHSPGRFFTTVPQQALFMMNSPFVERASQQVAARKDVADEPDVSKRVNRLYHTLFGRTPSAEEAADGVAFVNEEQSQAIASATPWRYGSGKYDPTSDHVIDFKPLTRFVVDHWQPASGATLSDLNRQSAALSAVGGHPGVDANSSVIRRWIAREDGTVTVSGTVAHSGEKGDGILARIVSSRSGQIGSWTVQRISAATNLNNIPVKKGDILDFIVECRADNEFDSFTWSPNLRLAGVQIAAAGSEGVIESDAQRDFAATSATAMSPWEKYAQVLLMSNEFVFVD